MIVVTDSHLDVGTVHAKSRISERKGGVHHPPEVDKIKAALWSQRRFNFRDRFGGGGRTPTCLARVPPVSIRHLAIHWIGSLAIL